MQAGEVSAQIFKHQQNPVVVSTTFFWLFHPFNWGLHDFHVMSTFFQMGWLKPPTGTPQKTKSSQGRFGGNHLGLQNS